MEGTETIVVPMKMRENLQTSDPREVVEEGLLAPTSSHTAATATREDGLARERIPEDRESEVFRHVYLPKNSHIIKLLQRIRDESHRFAITYHTLLKTKSMLK